ncbi:MAG: hypothetical protein JNN15_14865, partial [Blastocatellia bacterium]|nr:hypothetical protein [Blastocatellia bacterium]
SGLVSIAKSTDFNSPAASNSAIEKAARLIVGNVIGSGLASKLDQEKMMNAITSFVENDPVVGQKLRGLLERLA